GIKTHYVEIKIAKLFIDLFFVENTYDRIFAVYRRHDRDAEVNSASFITDSKSAVLRHAALSNVQFGHYLDSTDQRLMKCQVHRIDFGVKGAVDTIFNLHFSVPRLD